MTHLGPGPEPYRFGSLYIPARMMDGLRRYVRDHAPPGDFLLAVLSNDLREAVGRADDENIRNLPAYVMYLYNEVPGECWGSPEHVEQWLAERPNAPT